jgi:N-hydroxyarylamine O-acetyltransferase
MFDVDLYLERIGASADDGIAALHRAHVTSIPFENLDPLRGVPVALAPEDLVRKLVVDRRGGYCFEHNLLFAGALRALGIEVDLMLARVRGPGPPVTRPPSHLVLRVRLEGEELHADVGFGMGTLLEPIPFGPGDEYEQSGWRFRVVAEGSSYVLQSPRDGDWVDQYAFEPVVVPEIDVQVQSWFTSTHPASRFVTGLVVGRYRPDGMLTLLSDWSGELSLREAWPDRVTSRVCQRDEIPALLAERFGLDGFELDDEGRVVTAATG